MSIEFAQTRFLPSRFWHAANDISNALAKSYPCSLTAKQADYDYDRDHLMWDYLSHSAIAAMLRLASHYDHHGAAYGALHDSNHTGVGMRSYDPPTAKASIIESDVLHGVLPDPYQVALRDITNALLFAWYDLDNATNEQMDLMVTIVDKVTEQLHKLHDGIIADAQAAGGTE